MAEVKYINAKELQAIYKKPDVVIFDIREPDEFAREHIIGAKNAPLSQLDVNQFNTLNDEQVVVFHCQSGNRTRMNENKFKQLKCKTVLVLQNGFAEWKTTGCAITQNAKAPLPIMRQVQMIAGFFVVLGVILGFFISPYFSLFSGFVGLGLMFAGITGYCGMANMLMFLPYNKPK
jgi:rhodanese-related sulfurtransferase